MAECLPCSRGRCEDCSHPTCTCDHEPPEMVFGPCPDAPDCALPSCDGSDLGHTLAAEFPVETARVDDALTGMMRADMEETLAQRMWSEGAPAEPEHVRDVCPLWGCHREVACRPPAPTCLHPFYARRRD